MAQDYRKKQIALKKHKKTPNTFIPIALFFLLGYLTASLFDFHQLTAFIGQQLAVEHKIQKVHPLAQSHNLPKPKFEFYDVLTAEGAPVHQEAPITETQAEKSPIHQGAPVVEAKPVKQNKQINDGMTYWIQVASFKTKTDADKFKASLLLKGYEAKITSNMSANMIWYRVNVGPYPSTMHAEKAQMTIAKEEKVMGIIRKLDSE